MEDLARVFEARFEVGGGRFWGESLRLMTKCGREFGREGMEEEEGLWALKDALVRARGAEGRETGTSASSSVVGKRGGIRIIRSF